ncbi:MAG: hypothetical protein GY928_00225 [Colwellia sp.]|nr:hypothetical protein [Colwellia sp.]
MSLIPNFIGKRWLKISLRTVHLVGFAGIFSSILTGTEQHMYWGLTIVAGLGLVSLEALSNFVWFIQIRALAMYIKLILLTCVFFFDEYAWYCLVAIIIISGLISHAPSSVRYYSFVHGKKITSLNDTKG